MGSLKDKLWIWGHEAGSHNGIYGIPGESRITPLEAACYMGIPKIIMVEYHGKPPMPWRQYALPLSTSRELVWSIVGAGGRAIEDHGSPLNEVLSLANEFPNISGVMMDDYFQVADEKGNRYLPRLTVEQLCEVKKALQGAERPLDLWVVVYDYQVDLVPQSHLDLCDVITFWTWKADDLASMERNLGALRARVPGKRIVLGCYMWDYGNGKPMPVETMRRQCELGLKYLKSGEIEGMIFLASCICGLGLEAVEFTREWVRENGGQVISDQ